MMVNLSIIEPELPFDAADAPLGELTFLSHVRAGLAVAGTLEGTAVRATATIKLKLTDNLNKTRLVKQQVTLLGPGDVVGLDPSQIIRRFPIASGVGAADNLLAFVEFDRPEFPWLFTPGQPLQGRLQPWVALVVTAEARSEISAGQAGLPPVLETRLGELQPLEDNWAFVHAQVFGLPGGPGAPVIDRVTDAYATTNLSRVMCPRRLRPDTAYRACLVPAFDIGVKAGLGLPGGTLDPAWTRDPGEADADEDPAAGL
jgi:hypothetical protein